MTLGAVRPELREIPIAAIDEPTLPSRSTMDEQRMDDLVASIRTLGFISTIAVVRVAERYEVIAGHRRRIAAARAGLATVPCLVYPSRDAGTEAIQHAENRHREDLSPTDEAIWFEQLREQHPDDGTDGVAARVGEKRDYVEGRLALLYGAQEVFDALAEGAIKIGVAQQLNKCTEPAHRRMLLDMAVRGGATVGLVTQWVHEWKTIHQPASVNAQPIEQVSAGGAVLQNEYFRCRICGERDNTAHMQPVNAHDYCLRAAIDPATGLFRSKADYVLFPRTRDDAEALLHRVLERFPEMVPQ